MARSLTRTSGLYAFFPNQTLRPAFALVIPRSASVRARRTRMKNRSIPVRDAFRYLFDEFARCGQLQDNREIHKIGTFVHKSWTIDHKIWTFVHKSWMLFWGEVALLMFSALLTAALGKYDF